MKMHKTKVEEVEELATYVKGFAAGRQDTKLEKAADWLDKLSYNMCGQGYVGCRGGRECSSDHK